MCGIVGAFSLYDRPLDSSAFKPMVDTMSHRGPDDAGYYVATTSVLETPESDRGFLFTDSNFTEKHPNLPIIDSCEGQSLLAKHTWKLFLGHRRLAVIDLSPKGHQPMTDRTGTLWLVYNGEIYNFREIRDMLKAKGHCFVSSSDSEVVIHAYREWGIDCVARFNGMFAFALWDNQAAVLHLARDRYGIKPLYYCFSDGMFLFASEIKSILAYIRQKPVVDLLALNEYFSFQNIFSSRTLFSNIRLLPPAVTLTIQKDVPPTIRKYWDFDFTHTSDKTEYDLKDELYDLIAQAVKRQCVSDVPIGCYLSGGMDSASIASLLAHHFGRIYTFTAGFDLSEAAEHEMRFDEREIAENMSRLLQTEHYECVLHSGDIEAVLDKLVWHLEDLRVGQCYPNFCVARLAGKFVKVVMAGTGGDELFGGYPWRYAAAIRNTGCDYVQNYYRYWNRLIPNADKPRFFNEDISTRLAELDDDGAVPFRDHTYTVFRNVFCKHPRPHTLEENINLSLYFESKTFLHGLLVVEDRLSMAHSLETRVPFLDNDLVDFACRVPVSYKIAKLHEFSQIDENTVRKKAIYDQSFHSGKNILRQTMRRILPSSLIEARKQGFSAPDESWFRGSSEGYVNETLLNKSARINEFISPVFVREILAAHSSGRQNKRLLIWSLLTFELLLRKMF